jgi:protease-4
MAVRRGVLIVFILIFLAMAASCGGLLVLSMFVSEPPSIPANATLYLPIRAPFPEVEPSDLVSQFVARPATLWQTVEAIKKAKVDARVKALVITPISGGGLWGQLQEVRQALEDFRTSGRPSPRTSNTEARRSITSRPSRIASS